MLESSSSGDKINTFVVNIRTNKMITLAIKKITIKENNAFVASFAVAFTSSKGFAKRNIPMFFPSLSLMFSYV